jgi:hypothetical protein
MADQDFVAFLEEIFGEAVSLIRRRLEERAIDSSLVSAVSPDGKVVLRNNVNPECAAAGEDPKSMARDLRAPAKAGCTKHWLQRAVECAGLIT